MTHSTGHKSRLDRDFSGRFGTEAYAFEELVAELGSAFLNADLGIIGSTLQDHADYLASWVRILRNDKRAILTAAAAASKAHAYIAGLVSQEQAAA
jgi:antirestriction protein ArdC